jgi:hypothetical protein
MNDKRLKDKYDLAIEYLKEKPNEIKEAWDYPKTHPAGCLFQYVSKNGERCCHTSRKPLCGCLTQIRKTPDEYEAPYPLKTAIANDERLPKDINDVTIDDLEVFADWQRRLDEELRNESNPG